MMDKYDQAIAYFKKAIKESDEIIADCSPDLRAELTEQKEHFVTALETLRNRPHGYYVIIEPCHNLEKKLRQLRGKSCTYGDVDFSACLHIQERISGEGIKPLTLDELRQMDGEPVWIQEGGAGHWELSADAADYLEDRDLDFYGMIACGGGLHQSGWLAYRRKPTIGKPTIA